ncbi:MAG: ribose-5-phosphate isomerase RpiA [Bacteroides sp.]|nr:ribose-5-phosphate isomerase RpiA [Prevotella sp.]MCM1407135.1 ribose-5-phosphate isomerase RpiA [Treponema brennaborense]MCM1470287.1 ribose-5-phosphate isomerase RpiA [Bacteroides sp.]
MCSKTQRQNTAPLTQQEQKKLVGEAAIDRLIERGMIFSGMNIGLGTGSTAATAVRHLAEKIADGTLADIHAVSTSFQTSIACETYGIPLFTLNSSQIAGSLDLAIDGADEITPNAAAIKGGGAAHLMEKIIEYNAKNLVFIADESKQVPHLGTKFPVPIEVIPAARVPVMRELEKLGAACTIREGIKKAGPVITDSGNIIIDCLWQQKQLQDGTKTSCADPFFLEDAINSITGVVENGFFTKKHPIVFIAHADGTVTEY